MTSICKTGYFLSDIGTSAMCSRRRNYLPSPHRPYDLKIELQGQVTDHLGYSPLYKHTAEELEAAKQYVQDNLHKGFIAPSSAPFASPILSSRKHDADDDGGLRFCVDYRQK